jgi:hypothetical protein
MIGEPQNEEEEEEFLDEEEGESAGNAETTAPSPEGSDAAADEKAPTQADIALAKLWPMRYLGIHCQVEDALQYDDRAIYPRASSRLGPRHQANVHPWYGRPIKLVKPVDIKRKYVKGGAKKDSKLSRETVAALEAHKKEKAKRPKWVEDEPPGYVHRGEDIPNDDPNCSAELLFRMPPFGEDSGRGQDDAPPLNEEQLQDYMAQAKKIAPEIGVREYSTNFLDKALELFQEHQFDAEAALKALRKVRRREDLHEPELNKDELKKFEEGVAKYGSELRNVRLHVRSLTHADVVRFYYMWKKTPAGKRIWSAYGGRKGKHKKIEQDPSSKLLDDIAHDQDDSAFDNDKAMQRKRVFQCKFCSTRYSPQWRRAPAISSGQSVSADGKKGKNDGFILALCQRCAGLWRKYAIVWENIDEIAKKVASGGIKASKKRIDEELLKELMAANEEAAAAQAEYAPIDPPSAPGSEPPKKKLKLSTDKDKDGLSSSSETTIKKKPAQPASQPAPKAPTPPPPIIPNQPKWRDLPCAICDLNDVENDQLMTCKECKLTVHRKCFGIESRRLDKWTCDMCKNERKESVSYVSIPICV